MSTKTSIKRIALVAVSALGFGLMSIVSVPSANAAEVTSNDMLASIKLGTSDSNGTAADVTITQREDVAVTAQHIGVDVTAPTAEGDITLLAAFTSKPASSALVVPTITATDTDDSVGANGGSSTRTAGSGSAAEKLVLAPSSNDSIADDLSVGTITFTPDVPGTYVVKIWHDQNANSLHDSTEKSRLITVNAGAAATTLAVASYATTATIRGVTNTNDAFENGSLFILQLTDTNGGATALASGEGITITSTGCQISIDGWSTTASDTATLTSSTTPSNSRYRVNVGRTTAGTCVTTFTGAGTLASAFSAQSSTSTFKTGADEDLVAAAIDETTGVDTTTVGAMTSDTAGSAVAASTSKKSIAFLLTNGATAAATNFIGMNVNDVTGAITGYAGAKYTEAIQQSATATTGTAAASVTAATWSATKQAATNTLAADNYVVTFVDTTATTNTTSNGVTVTATAASTDAALSTWNITSINAVAGGTVTATLTIKDQFGLARSGQAITFVIAGRNAANTVVKNAVTDSLGKATLTYTDVGTATSAAVDTLSVSGVTATVTVSFDANNAVDTVVVNSGDTTDGVANLSVAWKDILAGKAGPTSSTNDVTATVKNAAGVAIAGAAVTFTVAGDGCAIPSNEVTVYTGSTGIATSAVYAWLAGKCTVTATTGGKTGTGVTSFRQESTSEIRTISGSVSGSLVTVAPKDRFGNPVINATVYAVVTGGTGYFGSNGARSATLTTDGTGTASVVVAGGDATVKLTTINPSGTGLATDQSTAAAGYVAGDVAVPALFTATTTGTATTAETGVGASFAPAGISSVSLNAVVDKSAQIAAEAATDAAAEAIDAANAATDAANLAAEAADAATVAAEEARDAADAATAAVEELATQVATLMAALKAQITTLANTVAKIAKKVKA
jgi:hypothetical protein